MNVNTDSVEVSALKIGVLVNLLMAVAGWVAYSLTGSEALLLDGNFSFISSLTTVGAILIIKSKHKRTVVFPYGRYFYESFFTLSKGVLILGLTVAALFQNVIKILDFIEGKSLEKLKTGPILIYMTLMLVLCFGTAFFYRFKNKKINNQSTILGVETKASMIDGYMTIAIGIALVLTTIVPESSEFSFLLYIGDAIIVILMCFFLLRIPFGVIKEGFIELGGGSLQDDKLLKLVDNTIQTYIPDSIKIIKFHASKTGSSHLLLIYAKPRGPEVNVELIERFRLDLFENLVNQMPNPEIEIVLRP
ncbi:cation transporter [Lutimonas saemankumensis]|uniref:cation transporter n=1 Tax=Lutimonas saemankumensis TaxID=483016 RepID=UPI001CD27797|nr:cation transporter [Lutimonas saemankumensis]MCA0932951.1 cation transporter [Lutimonas saemankumensis]